jgi:hypothetical protein
MSDEARARLASRQAELIRALYGGPPGDGLDTRMVALTSAALAHKRARAVGRAWPALARELGTDFAGRFVAYALAAPPPDCGALADGLAFSQALAREGPLPGDVHIEHIVASARVRLRHHRFVNRRGPHLVATITGRPRRLVIVVSFPPIGTRVVMLSRPTRWHLRRRADGSRTAHKRTGPPTCPFGAASLFGRRCNGPARDE